jgi:peptide-methionine (R)-S-oxide reductase
MVTQWWVFVFLAMGAVLGCSQRAEQDGAAATTKEQSRMATDTKSGTPPEPKSDTDWQKVLTPEEFRVTRHKGTERPFSGAYWKPGPDGVFRCVCCGAPLFTSADQFEAGCGWPSFTRPVENGNVRMLDDDSLGMHRIEVQCRHCGAHLGHVFDDGPGPTHQRFCINSVSLRLEAKGGKAP